MIASVPAARLVCSSGEAGFVAIRKSSSSKYTPIHMTYGWFAGFVRRHNISNRKVTKQATKLPHEYTACVNSFLRFIKRNSQPHGPSDMRILMEPSCFTPSTILNLDETPIPFEYLDGHTYEICGAKTVSGKTDRIGWSKRQATLILYVFADGIQRI